MTLILLLLELSLLAAAGYTLSTRWGNTPAESGAYALLMPLVALTAGANIALLVDMPLIGWIWEGLLAITALTVFVHLRATIRTVWDPVFQTIKAHPVAASAFAVIYLVFLVQLFYGNPNPLEPFIQTVPGNSLGTVPPGNVQALSYWLARTHGPAAPVLGALMAYGAIAFATYALARRYAWPPAAMTVTLMVISMPRLVCLTSAGSSEIIHAAACLLGLLIVYRLVESPSGRDLLILLMIIGFGISTFQLGWLYPVLILPLAMMIIFRRHGLLFLKTVTKEQSVLPALTLLPTVLFAAFPLLVRFSLKAGTTANTWPVPLNPDGIQGALANGIRYLIETIHLTLPVDQLGRFLFQNGVVDLLQQIYTIALFPLLANLGAITPFQIHWAPNAEQAWFGPFGFLVILPALLYALVKGPRRLKAVAVSLVSYFYLVTLIPAWQPGNAAFFTVFFTVGGYSAAFSLPPWRFSIRTRLFIQTASVMLLFYSLLFNPSGLLAHQLPQSF